MKLINRTQMRRYILEKIKQLRNGMPITRVSESALDKYESKLMAMIVADVERHPSRGKTFTEVMP